MKKITKLISIFLSLIILISGFEISLFSVSAETSGTTGDCEWELDDGNLTISGNGAMEDYDFVDHLAPWGKSITKVEIKDGVTRIGDNAFYG